MWLCSSAFVATRRRRVSRLIDVLERLHTPAFGREFVPGIAHLNDNPLHKDELYSVVRAFSTHKMHYLGVLRELLKDVSFDDSLFFWG